MTTESNGHAQPGCEAIVLSNWTPGRDDQVGCSAFTPVDHAEALARGDAHARRRRRAVAGPPARPDRTGRLQR